MSTSCVASSAVAAPPKRRQNHHCPQRQPPSRSCASVGRVQPAAPAGSPHPRSAPLSTTRIAALVAATNCAATLAASRRTRQSAPGSDTQGQRERETKRDRAKAFDQFACDSLNVREGERHSLAEAKRACGNNTKESTTKRSRYRYRYRKVHKTLGYVSSIECYL